ncbi:glucose-1-phosphate adenylyltransferase, GlgD subunit [Alkaliphilus metalliredigens QYMF]|uniref:Glucose-1-phosphate adenylyltransferase, GlgD subunit n=1 Tax=Alkaliphilus metalliredigens (strain QYMF) TaxID=293826 RepID=A6TSC9_ALKMQ|nr:glucose-1-phosphate adenylyltransferase subunit GlgD [Alkaliphilus metalliredigens]ABR49097.1 glucose-1-phosphate adenylyltransferase, GlgD subunit [Alkaliphilus metalliredigens QYMF]
MKDVMGIVNDIKIKRDLRDLVSHRSTAAVPFGGRYRVVDFVLSNMANGGIKNVGIFTQSNNRSLLDHVDSGKAWDLFNKRGGLFILPPTFSYERFGNRLGDIDHFYNHMDYLERSTQQYVLISNSNSIYNMDYSKIKEAYEKSGADIVILYQRKKEWDSSIKYVSMIMDEKSKIVDMSVNKLIGNNSFKDMGVAFMKKELFMEIIRECHSKGLNDFVKDGLIKNTKKYNMYGMPYDGYVANIDSINNYYKHNMNLLKPEIWKQLFFKEGLINTKVKDEAPSKYNKTAKVSNSLVANGCIIEGEVINSILFRGVKVGKNVTVKNSILMQKNVIHEGCQLEHVILDKDVVVTEGKVLKGDEGYPFVVSKKTVL